MNFILDMLTDVAGTAVALVAVLAAGGAFVFLSHFVLTLPLRRAERARLFLDLMEDSIKQGRPVEETIVSLSQSRDMSMDVGFHTLAARIEENRSVGEALKRTPGFLSPQITAMLATGQKIGDVRKVLPACRQLLKDAVSQTRVAVSYLIILTVVITPMGLWVLDVLKLVVFPKVQEIAEGTLGSGADLTQGIDFLLNHQNLLFAVHISLLALLWLGALIYLEGPRFGRWFSVRLPWRRKRLARDFSAMLAILIDSGVAEQDAILLAAESTADRGLLRRAHRAVSRLKQGVQLPETVSVLDDSGEFRWRLANAIHGKAGFLQVLSGWHESLDAKAFQEEQAAAHVITSTLVLYSGVWVGAVVISVFMFLTSFINAGVLW